MNDWYEAPKTKTKPLPFWLRHLLFSIVTGISSGVLMAILLILKSYLLPDGKFDYELSKELWVIMMALLVGASMGLLFGAPIAFVFAPTAIKLTEGINEKFRFWIRLLLGGIGGYLGFFLIRLLSKSTRLFDFDFNSIIIPMGSGIIGAAIYLGLSKSSPQSRKD